MKYVLIIISLYTICISGEEGEKTSNPGRIRLATTTSTDNSGLLEVLLPPFVEESGFKVDVIAVGTGKALTLGVNGVVDAVLVHARKREEKFVADGHGVGRRDVMHNDFVILGPDSDPAGVQGMTSATKTLKGIYRFGGKFISRGDDSGTHTKERELWLKAKIKPRGKRYIEAGQGMGAVITMAYDMNAYTLSDRGTYLAMQEKTPLKIFTEGDDLLFNPYGIIAVNPERHPHVNYSGAVKLIDYLVSKNGQELIRDFKINGQVLFFPDVLK